MDTKRIKYPVRTSKDVPGECIVPVASEEEPHEFILLCGDEQVDSGCFRSKEIAEERIKVHYPDLAEYTLKDVTEEWYIQKALCYRDRIKKLRKSFAKSNIILDTSRMIYTRRPENWYTYIPFTYNGQEWEYREDAGGDYIAKVPCKKQVADV